MKLLVGAAAASCTLLMAIPAFAATQAECEAHWRKLDANKTGYVTGPSATDHMDRMKKAGRRMAQEDRISDKEFMDSCLADILQKSDQ